MKNNDNDDSHNHCGKIVIFQKKRHAETFRKITELTFLRERLTTTATSYGKFKSRELINKEEEDKVRLDSWTG